MVETSICILVRNSQIILANKRRGFGAGKLNSPGGKLNPGEKPEDCARRETEEETHLVVGVMTYTGKLRFFHAGENIRYNNNCHVFIAHEWTGQPAATEEFETPHSYSLDNIPYEQMWTPDKYWLPVVLSGKKVDALFRFDDKLNLVDFSILDVTDGPF